MINKNDEWNLDLEINEDFSIAVKDLRTCTVSGAFSSGEIQYLVTEKFSPEELYVNGELEKWAEDNGYKLEE